MKWDALRNHQQVLANRYLQDVDTAGWGEVTTGGPAWHFSDTPERWIDLAWDESAVDDTHTARIDVTVTNEPGSLGELSTLIARNEGNISNLKVTGRTADFFDLRIDVQVRAVRQLTNIIAALRASAVINSVERARG